MMPCPDEHQLERDGAGVWAEHLATCDDCRTRLAAIEANNAFLSGHKSLLSQQYRSLPDVPGYDLLREIDRGGQGTVYEATQTSTQQRVAVKILTSVRGVDRARYQREVKVLAQLDHPGIVQILDSGSCEAGFFLVMRFVQGVPLDQWEASSPRTAARVFARICEAVHAAHLRGIIHRDLKPGNILVDASETPCVLDFGLAKLHEQQASPETRTQTGCFVGSLPWASPEQVGGATSLMDARSDIYSLGVMLFQTLTKQFPYRVSGNLPETLQQIASAEPPRLSSIDRNLDDELNTIVQCCLEKEPHRRYQSVLALQQDLQRYLAGEPLEARRNSTWYVLRKTATRHRAKLLVACGFLVLILAFALDRGRRAQDLEKALHLANLERGRLAGQQGHTSLAEELLWGEYARGSGDPASHWALREFFAAQPCRAQWRTSSAAPVRVIWNQHRDEWLCVQSDQIERWQIQDGLPRRLQQVTAIGQASRSVALSPDGTQLLVQSSDQAVFYTASTLEMQTQWACDASLQWCANDRVMQIAPDRRALQTRSAADGALTDTWTFDADVSAFGLDPQGAHLALLQQASAEVTLYDVGSREPLQRWAAPPPRPDAPPVAAWAEQLEVTPDGQRIAGIYWDMVTVWRRTADTVHFEHPTRPNAALLLGDALLVVGGRAGVRVWDTNSVTALGQYGGRVMSMAGASDDAFAVGSDKGRVRVWEPVPHAGRTNYASVSAHSCTADASGRHWYVGSGGSFWSHASQWHRHQASAETLSDVVLYRDEPLASGYASNQLISPDGTRYTIPLNGVASLAAHEAQLFIGGNRTGTVLGYHDLREPPIWTRNDLATRVPALAASEEHVLVGDGGGYVSLLKAASGETIWQTKGDPRQVRSVVFAGEELLASGGDDGVVRLWSRSDGNPRGELRGHRGVVYGLAYLPDEHVLVSGGHDGLLRVWSLDERRNLATFPVDGQPIAHLAADPRGGQVLYATFDGHAGVWRLDHYDRHVRGNSSEDLQP